MASESTREAAKASVAVSRCHRRHRDRPVVDGGLQLAGGVPERHPPRPPPHRRSQRGRDAGVPRCRHRPLRAASSSATAEGSARIGGRRAAEGRRRRCSAPSTSWPARRTSTADFRAVMHAAMAKRVGDVKLRVRTPRGAVVTLVQAGGSDHRGPHRSGRARRRADGRLPDRRVGRRATRTTTCASTCRPARLATRCWPDGSSLVVDGEARLRHSIRAVWTDDVALSTRINPEVAHYTGPGRAGEGHRDGPRGAAGPATTRRPPRNSAGPPSSPPESGNDGTLRLLAAVVDIDDATAGTVRLKRNIDAADEMALDTRSTKTVRVRPE